MRGRSAQTRRTEARDGGDGLGPRGPLEVVGEAMEGGGAISTEAGVGATATAGELRSPYGRVRRPFRVTR